MSTFKNAAYCVAHHLSQPEVSFAVVLQIPELAIQLHFLKEQWDYR
jgi:hypothetical protein